MKPTHRMKMVLLFTWTLAWGLLVAAVCPSPYGVNSSVMFPVYSFSQPAYNLEPVGGFGWHRATMLWDEIETANGACTTGDMAHCDWSVIEADIDAANANLQSVLVDILHTPAWAAGPAQISCASNNNWCNATGTKTFACPPVQSTMMYNFARAAALHFGTKVAAWEIWGEPNLCGTWRGTKLQFRENVLRPAYEGLRSVTTDAPIGAPGLFNSANFDPWITNSGALVVPLDFYSLHTYESVADATAHLTAADAYLACTADGSSCVSHYWLTEYGYADAKGGQSCTWGAPCDAGVAAVSVLDTCVQSPYCDKAFYWDMFKNDPDCLISLLDDSANPRTRFCTIRDYIVSGTMHTCPYSAPPCTP